MEPKEWLKQKEYGISAHALKQLIQQAKKEEMEMLKALNPNEVYDYMISKLNFCQRKQVYNYKEILPQIRIRKGDICFIDFWLSKYTKKRKSSVSQNIIFLLFPIRIV